MWKLLEYGHKLHHLFIDLKVAGVKLDMVMRMFGIIRTKLVRLILIAGRTDWADQLVTSAKNRDWSLSLVSPQLFIYKLATIGKLNQIVL